MKKGTSFILLLSLIMFSCKEENFKLENKITECSYDSSNDNGEEIKRLFFGYQNSLISEGYLADSSGKSYKTLLTALAQKDSSFKIPFKSYFTERLRVNDYNSESYNSCIENVLSDSISYNQSKFKILTKTISNLQYNQNLNTSVIASEMLKILTIEDFELNFYKNKVLMLVSLPNKEIHLINKIPRKKVIENSNNHEKTLTITLDSLNQILFERKAISSQKLKEVYREHLIANRENAVLNLQVHLNTEYKKYLEIMSNLQKAIMQVRNEKSKEIYGLSFSELENKQRIEIVKIVPEKIKQ